MFAKVRSFVSSAVTKIKTVVNDCKVAIVGGLGLGLTVAGHAQSTTPVDTVTGAAATSQTAWAAFAAISASAFVFAMIIRYSRKGTK